MANYKHASFFVKLNALTEPISSTLLFPDEFVRVYGEMLPKEAHLITTNENHGRCWKVKVARLYSGRFCFAGGWPRFVDQNPHIQESHFAVFQLVNASTFKASFFGNDGLKIAVPSIPPVVTMNKSRDRRRRRVDNVIRKRARTEVDGVKTFTYPALATYHYHRLTIPKCFAEKTGIANRSNIKLKNEDGVSWVLEVVTREDKRTGKTYLCLCGDDWANYWNNNSLNLGDKLIFSIVGDDFSTLHVSRTRKNNSN